MGEKVEVLLVGLVPGDCRGPVACRRLRDDGRSEPGRTAWSAVGGCTIKEPAGKLVDLRMQPLIRRY